MDLTRRGFLFTASQLEVRALKKMRNRLVPKGLHAIDRILWTPDERE
jgi:hypothetical protein